MGYNIIEKQEGAPLSADCDRQEKSEQDILTWEA